ncbi:MAG: alpha/beta hydrolase [Pyrinomonadaceae bacterium]
MPFTENEGTKIYWDEYGGGQPLLLIMGLGSTSDLWYRLLPELSSHYRTILFDNRGVGRSDVPPGPYSITTMASDAAAVMNAAGAGAAHVLGFSMGGFIAQELALNYPEKVRALILAGTACGGRDAVRAAPEVLVALEARGVKTLEEAFWMMAPYNYDSSTLPARLEEDLAASLRTPLQRKGYVAQLQGIALWAGSHNRLSKLDAPVLIIHGESDQLIPPANARILASAIANSRVVMIPRAGHRFMTDQPEAASEAILSFLENAEVQSGGSLI